ncbi:hypothetical protein [Mycoplasma sp. ATU-Cv-508]|uniref:hypothetical protein n=1 Tax=Mycoplasma sp. ATU-Cv-508 TaxID=2048001 RepID=UPI000FDE6217
MPPANGPNGFLHASIAIGVILALLVFFLVFNYGILGLISTLSFGLFTFLALTLFIVFGGIFSVLALAGFFSSNSLYRHLHLNFWASQTGTLPRQHAGQSFAKR